MEDPAYLRVLNRVGTVLVAVGLLDIGLMIYCIAKGISYSSIFNIFALVAGIFLIRGSLRAAGIVLWFATFYLTGFSCLLVAWPIFLPPGLALTEVRLYPLRFAGFLIVMAAVLAILCWTVRQLRMDPVLSARMRAGAKVRSLRGAFLAGVGLVVILGLLSTFTSNSERAKRAKEAAAAQIGAGYRYQVDSIHSARGRSGTEVSAVITAWNGREVRHIQVHWKEH